jgi:serine/threonine kinase 38
MPLFAEIMQVSICREKTSKNVYAMKNLKKSEMLHRGQVPCMIDLCYLVYYYCCWFVNCPLTFVHICQVEHAKAEKNLIAEVDSADIVSCI